MPKSVKNTASKGPAKKAVKKKGKRYNRAFQEKVVSFVIEHNKKNGRGGAAAASKKFKISNVTISNWVKALGDEVGNGKAAQGPRVGNGKSVDTFADTLEKLSALHAHKKQLLARVEEVDKQINVLKKKL